MRAGARPIAPGIWEFRVWAPKPDQVLLEFPGSDRPALAMESLERGWRRAEVEGLAAGERYAFRLNGGPARPDPASRHQPDGPHAPSALVDHRTFAWTDRDFRPPALDDLIIYELHVGTFSPEGTFEGLARRLDHLLSLGVTAVQLMPAAAFPGKRNWGYDGTFPYAVQAGYGGPEGLKRLVDACHAAGLAVILDVVHNHLGPEGNYLREFGPYFTERHATPWGPAVNFDGPDSDPVRSFFLESALAWIGDYHADGLRLDAVHAIHDESPRHYLAELAEAREALARQTGRRALLIAESEANDPRLVRPRAVGGLGLDAVLSDDFHHAAHALLTGERGGYYADYGSAERLREAVAHGFAYQGRYSTFFRRRRGAPAQDLPPAVHVACLQNHDQVGNRVGGERLSSLVPAEALGAAAVLLLCAPSTPLLFMGEEYGEDNPFLYFIDHGDPRLVAAVRRGRRAEFAAFAKKGRPPDPAAEATFRRSRPDLSKSLRQPGAGLFALYRRLIGLRKTLAPFRENARESFCVALLDQRGALALTRRGGGETALCLVNLSPAGVLLDPAALPPPGSWRRIVDTAAPNAQPDPDPALPPTLAPFQAIVCHGREEAP